MDKNHSQKFTDRQLDSLIKTILQSTIITDEELDEIAEAPRFRRQTLNHIADEKSRRKQPWFFALGWQAATATAFLFLMIAGAAFWFLDSRNAEVAAVPNAKFDAFKKAETEPFEFQPEKPSSSTADATETFAAPRRKKSTVKTEKSALKTKSTSAGNKTPKAIETKSKTSPRTEYSTEFIALSYLPATESGQVVRVKVPRSMLVSLGVSTNVARNQELISAEVIVGDDGAARAIRFLNE